MTKETAATGTAQIQAGQSPQHKHTAPVQDSHRPDKGLLRGNYPADQAGKIPNMKDRRKEKSKHKGIIKQRALIIRK